MSDSDNKALGIYVVAARDWSDALEMIQECEDVEALSLLLKMLENPGGPDTDVELNKLFQEPVRRQLAKFQTFDRWLTDNAGRLQQVNVVGPDQLVHRIARDEGNSPQWRSCPVIEQPYLSVKLPLADSDSAVTCLTCAATH